MVQHTESATALLLEESPQSPLVHANLSEGTLTMANRASQEIPILSSDQRRIAAENFERARQVLQTGNYDYGIYLLRDCCRMDPTNFLFRQALRRAQKEKYDNNLRGSRFAFFFTPRNKAKIKAAKASRDYLRVLELGEDVLTKNPWDMGTQMDMAEAFDALGLLDLAVFSLDQARQKYPKDATLNRSLARLYEKRGDYQKAIHLWHLVQKTNPQDVEAASKAKDLAASETIAKGGYAEAAAGTKDSPVVSRIEARSLEKQDKLGSETSAILKRIEAAPTEPALYIQLSGVYRRHQQLDRARATLQQGLGPTGKHFSLQVELLELDLLPLKANLETADKQVKLRKQQEANDEVIPEDEPNLAELRTIRNRLQKELIAREAEIFRMRADRQPSDMHSRFELGLRLMKLDKIEEAIAEFQQARREDRLKAKAMMQLGLCFQKRNNWRLAQRNFEEALQLLESASDEVTRKEVLYQLANGCATNGELERAVDLGTELANMDYGYKNIGKLIDDWQSQTQA